MELVQRFLKPVRDRSSLSSLLRALRACLPRAVVRTAVEGGEAGAEP